MERCSFACDCLHEFIEGRYCCYGQKNLPEVFIGDECYYNDNNRSTKDTNKTSKTELQDQVKSLSETISVLNRRINNLICCQNCKFSAKGSPDCYKGIPQSDRGCNLHEDR